MENEDITSYEKTKELEDAAACGKLWEIYAKEAQDYDSGLVESWKEDMDSILVFSGLYSAILTAFIIESYQNLQPNPADNSAVLLKRISQQLATPSNSSGLTPFPDDEPFSPASSALACNILWFISLALALTCAFLATLVQQWSRRFLHRTSTARSPGVHAHLLQYLYFGLKELKMHAVVDLIPSLLHLSLFSFFAGLVGFLHDVNNVLTWLFAGALAIVLLIYFTFTLLPLVYLSSPYFTPLSSVLWQIRELIRAILHSLLFRGAWDWLSRMKPGNQAYNPNEIKIQPPNDEEAQALPVVRVAEKITPSDMETSTHKGCLSLIDATLRESKKRRSEYESQCITWTLKSLNDDAELLPFLEALPHVLLGDDLDCLREGNFHLMDALVSGDPRTGIVSRTLSLMENAKNSWHEAKHSARCAIAGAKTLYSLARVLVDQKYRSKYTGPAKCLSLFSVATLERMMQDALFSTAESESFSNSLRFLCIISVLQSLDESIRACKDTQIPHSWFQEANTLLDNHFNIHDSDQPWMQKSGNEFSQRQARSAVEEMISATFHQYLYRAIREPSFNMDCISHLMVENGRNPFQFERRGGCNVLFSVLGFKFNPLEHERMDIIFGVALDAYLSPTSTRGSKDEQQMTLIIILEYISIHFGVVGWGSTKKVWHTADRLVKLLDFVQASLYFVSDSALQELLLHIVHEEDDVVNSFLEHSFRRIRSQAKMKMTPKSSLWFHLVIVILHRSQSQSSEDIPPILDLINDELHLDPGAEYIFTCPHIKDEADPEVTVILHCLDCKLPAKDTRDILQLFFHDYFSFDRLIGDWIQPNVLNELVKHSECFATEFLQTPSKELMDITALVWSLLWDVFLQLNPDTDVAGEALEAAWLRLKPLSHCADKLLSPDGRKTVDEEIKKSSPEQNRTILTLEIHIERLNLLNMVERVQERLSTIFKEMDRVRSPLTSPPSNTADKETDLTIDDHNTSQNTDSPQVADMIPTPGVPFKAELRVNSEPFLDADDNRCL